MAVCRNCGRGLKREPVFWVHLKDNGQTGRQACDPAESGLEGRVVAEPVGGNDEQA